MGSEQERAASACAPCTPCAAQRGQEEWCPNAPDGPPPAAAGVRPVHAIITVFTHGAPMQWAPFSSPALHPLLYSGWRSVPLPAWPQSPRKLRGCEPRLLHRGLNAVGSSLAPAVTHAFPLPRWQHDPNPQMTPPNRPGSMQACHHVISPYLAPKPLALAEGLSRWMATPGLAVAKVSSRATSCVRTCGGRR